MPKLLFPILDVEGWEFLQVEQMGKVGNRWLRDSDGRVWLWKPVTEQREATRTFLKGEDWAEKLASEIARRLEIPAATVELATSADRRGVVVASVLPIGCELDPGNQLLAATISGYQQDHRQEVPQYSLVAVADALSQHAGTAPVDKQDRLDALGVFVLYLGLDALIGNTDRHHGNWGVARHVGDGTLTICPSFDHASSLGFQLSDEHRSRLLAEDGGIDRDCRRGQARPFAGRPLLVELFAAGLQLRPGAGPILESALEGLDEDALAALVDQVPTARMSQPARIFVCKMWAINRRRVLDACRRSGA